MLLQLPPEQLPGNKLIFNIFMSWAYAWHHNTWVPQPERCSGGSMEDEVRPPWISLPPLRASRFIPVLWSVIYTEPFAHRPRSGAFQSGPLFWRSQAHKDPFPLRNTSRARRAPSCRGHPPAAMSPGAGERRRLLLCVRGVGQAFGAAALTVAASDRVCLAGDAPSLLPSFPGGSVPIAPRGRQAALSPALLSAGRGRRLPRKVLSHGLTRGRRHVRRRARSRRRGTERTRRTERTAHGRTRSAPSPLASSASLPPGRHGAAVAGLADELGGDAALRGARAAARHPPVSPHLPRPARPPQGRAQVGRRGRWDPCERGLRRPLSRAQVPFRCGSGRAVPAAMPGAGPGARPLGARGRCGLPGGALFTSRTHTRSPRFVAQRGCPAIARGSETLEQLSVFPPGTSRLPGSPSGGVFPGRWCLAPLAPSPEFIYAVSLCLSKACLCL